MSPLYIKLGLKEISMNAMDELSVGVAYLRQKFPTIHETKMKERIFAAPQITQLFGEKDFRTKLNFKERKTGRHFITSAETFLAMKKMKITMKLCKI
jgi:hypothetical protein